MIIKKLEDIEAGNERIVKKLDGLETKVDSMEARVGSLETSNDLIVEKLVDLDVKVESLLPLKQRFEEFEDRVVTTLDAHSVILGRLDQEQTVTSSRLDAVEEKFVA